MIRKLSVTVLSGFLETGISRIGRAGKIFEWIGLGSRGFDESALKYEARDGLV